MAPFSPREKGWGRGLARKTRSFPNWPRRQKFSPKVENKSANFCVENEPPTSLGSSMAEGSLNAPSRQRSLTIRRLLPPSPAARSRAVRWSQASAADVSRDAPRSAPRAWSRHGFSPTGATPLRELGVPRRRPAPRRQRQRNSNRPNEFSLVSPKMHEATGRQGLSPCRVAWSLQATPQPIGP